MTALLALAFDHPWLSSLWLAMAITGAVMVAEARSAK